MTITVTDCRNAGHCVKGIKNWFDQYGLDFKDFLRNGIDEETFLATNDAYAIEIVRLKKAKSDG